MIARLLIACLCCLLWAGDGACWEVVTSGGEAACSGTSGITSSTGTEDIVSVMQILTKVNVACSTTGNPVVHFLAKVTTPAIVRVGVYSTSASEPNSLVYESGNITISGSSFTEYQSTISSLLSSGDYWLGIRYLSGNDGNGVLILRTPSSGVARYYSAGVNVAWPATWNTSTDSDSTSARHIWITY